MKLYCELTDLQKDFAVDSALKVLVKHLVNTDFDYQFKSPLAQVHFFKAFLGNKTNSEIEEAILSSDEIAEELYDSAIAVAESAFYPTDGEFFFEKIAV